MVGTRNEFPEEVIESSTITTIKRQLDRHIDRKGLEGLGAKRRQMCIFVVMVDLSRRACFCPA